VQGNQPGGGRCPVSPVMPPHVPRPEDPNSGSRDRIRRPVLVDVHSREGGAGVWPEGKELNLMLNRART
jgi:hypothetical protein